MALPENSTSKVSVGADLEAFRAASKKRTAVLVVHGMGSQRVLSTVRGIVDAAWLDKDGPPGPNDKRYWLHPEQRNGDADLSVITTSEIPGTGDKRNADFHELYWAHLLSETRAVAVLLWLFELVRKGPRLKRGMRALWWGTTIFLCLLIQSVVLLLLHAVLQFLSRPPLIDSGKIKFAESTSNSINLWNYDYYEPEALLLAPFFVLFMVGSYILIFSALRGAFKIAFGALVIAVLAGKFFYMGINFEYDINPVLVKITVQFLPIGVSLCVAAIAMGRWGAIAMFATYLLSSAFFILYLDARYLTQWDHSGFFSTLKDIFVFHRGNMLTDPNWKPFSFVWEHGWIFWSLNERYSALIAVAIILIYFAVYALFLQPFLGDAARYFRPSPGNVLVRRQIRTHAVEAIEALHKWGAYDRIIVVAHSLGTAVAYDMLRTYFSRVNNVLPAPSKLEPEFSQIDNLGKSPGATMDEDSFRATGREIIRKIANNTVNSPDTSKHKLPTWLVTDFVTLGSPLTHAHYLMCNGSTEGELVADFHRRVTQREFPTCPPERQEGDGLLSFTNPNTRQEGFHHAALFGMTRWTNLFFPMDQLFWGDAIGGPLNGIWGPYVKDVEVSTHSPPKAAFFTHTAYWSLKKPGGRHAPQIQKLREAINLEDR
jgi:pimeloyl-ACP methyl ester carboxylesterase